MTYDTSKLPKVIFSTFALPTGFGFQFMVRIFSLLVCLTSITYGAKGQNQQSPFAVDPWLIFDNLCEQEGMFYYPEPVGSNFVNGQPPSEQRSSKNAKDPAVAIASSLKEIRDGNYEKALLLIQRASVSEDGTVSRDLLLIKGYTQYLLLQYEQAGGTFRMALSEAGNDHRNAIRCMIAQSLYMEKKFGEAEKKLRETLPALQSLRKARILVMLSELALRNGNFAASENYITEAIPLFRAGDDHQGEAMALRNRGVGAYRKSDYATAVTHFRHSMEVSPQLSVAKLLKDTYLKLFTIGSLAGDHQKSNDYNILYVSLRDSIDKVERSRILNSQFTRRELVEKEAIAGMLRRNTPISLKDLSPLELERNRQVIEAEIERLEKEKIIEDLNIARKLSDQATIERDDRIHQLTREMEQQELALSRKELEVSKARAMRTNLLIAFIFIIIIATLLFTRYRNQKKSHATLDEAYRDLSETHQKLIATQEQLVHSQKMASLGQLSAGIAHEIQNPLNFVNNFAELSVELVAELRSASDEEKEEILSNLSANLEKIHFHGKRADKIVKGMLTHARTGETEKVPVDINKMVDELLDLSYHGNRTRDQAFTADIIKNPDPQLPLVPIVMQELSRVLINLFNNAFYAVGQKVKTAPRTYQPSVGVSTTLSKGRVIIKVRDNGTGIPEKVKNRIFDPFFTTKPAGEGTGLGLSLSYDIIVKGHNGQLEVNSEEGSFTEFVITLPLDNTASKGN